MAKPVGKQPPKSPYEEYVYEPYIEPGVESLQKFLDESMKGVREGYNSATDSLGKAADEGLGKLKAALTSEPEPVKKQPKNEFVFSSKPMQASSVGEMGGPKIKDFIQPESVSSTGAVKQARPQIDTTTEGSQTVIRPDDIVDPASLVEMSEEDLMSKISSLNLPDQASAELKRRLFQKRAQMRQLRGKEMQDKGFLRFLIDEAKKK